MPRFKVALGHSLMLDSGAFARGDKGRPLPRLVKEGEMVPDGVLSPNEIENKLRQGSIVKVHVRTEEQAEAGPADVSGGVVPAPKVRPTETDDSDQSSLEVDKAASIHSPGETPEDSGSGDGGTIRVPDGRQRESVWDKNPEGLRDKDLDTLKLMILEVDPNFEGIDDISDAETAISILSEDYDPNRDPNAE